MSILMNVQGSNQAVFYFLISSVNPASINRDAAWRKVGAKG